MKRTRKSKDDPAVILQMLIDRCTLDSMKFLLLDGEAKMAEEKKVEFPLKLLQSHLTTEVGHSILAAHGDDDSLLHQVCYHPNVTLDVVRWLVELYPEALRHQTSYGWVPLHRACINDHISLEIVEYMINRYPEALRLQWRGKTPLACAIYCYGHRMLRDDIVTSILGKDPGCVGVRIGEGGEESTVVHLVCKQSKIPLNVVKKMVQIWPGSLHEREDGRLPLHNLFYHGRYKGDTCTELLDFLLKSYPQSASVSTVPNNHIFNESALPLHMACRRGESLDIIKMLGNAYPEAFNSIDNDGMYPLHHYCLSGKVDLPTMVYIVEKFPVALERHNHFGFLPASYAIRASLEIVRFMIERAPATAQDTDLFHSAAKDSSDDVLRYLLQHFPEGAKSRQMSGETILHSCVKCNHRHKRERLLFLMDLYPEAIKMKDEKGNLPLHVAAKYSYSQTNSIQLLLSRFPFGTKVQNSEGRLPLHLVFDLSYSSHELEKFLLDIEKQLLSANPGGVKQLDDSGRLPLHFACKNIKSVENVQYLVQQYPSSIHVVSPKHGLPIHEASKSRDENTSILVYLYGLSNETVYTYVAGIGTPLHCASREGGDEVFQLLLTMVLRGKEVEQGLFLHALFRDHDLQDKNVVAKRILGDFHAHILQRDSRGAAPLHAAVASDVGRETIERLIELDGEAGTLSFPSESRSSSSDSLSSCDNLVFSSSSLSLQSAPERQLKCAAYSLRPQAG
uniref:Uncharacterized protein n=1 Tax=Ditylum brightwellii TaxID=49249 RepID=A0A7S4QX19_9STRA